jgi:hypothetical protein
MVEISQLGMEDPEVTPSKATLTYEETPIIEPIQESSSAVAVPPVQPPAPVHTETPAPPEPVETHIPGVPHSSPKKNMGKTVGNVLFFLILFGLGVWLSLQLRAFLSSSSESAQVTPTPTLSVLPTLAPVTAASGSANVQGSWITYQVQSGASKKVMAGVSYKLPAAITAPVCDGSNCPSMGTNLSGGTRFTVAARGKGFTLPDFRGAILTDAAGHQFTMKQSIIGGKGVYEYIGDFAGRTGGGFGFSKMRGVLVPVTDLISVEFNHFAPVGVTSDFASDDALLDQIIASFDTAVVPIATSSPKGATTSGY